MLPLFVATALAQDALTLSAVRYTQDGAPPASVTFVSATDGRLDAELTCSSRRFPLSTTIRPGGEYRLELENLPLGTHPCTGKVVLHAADGTSGEMPLSLEVMVLEVLAIDVRPEDLDLAQRRLTVTANRPLHTLSLWLVDPDGASGSAYGNPHGSTRVALEWSADVREPVALNLEATDSYGLSAALVLSPWSYQIPHEDVVFASGSAEITASEAPKLERAWNDLSTVLDKYGPIIEVELFVAGYTDTVGAAASNQSLSEARARAIAAWFRARGFTGSIAYQGFGELGLAVPTADGTDEQRNRRAIYVLAADPPPISGEIPRGDWRKL